MNLFPSMYVVLSILLFHKHPPGLYAVLSEEEIRSMSSEMLMTVDSIGLFANLSVVALNLLILAIVWKGLINRFTWAYWVLLASCTISMLAGVAADYAVNFAFPKVNFISAIILAAGFAFSAVGLFKKNK